MSTTVKRVLPTAAQSLARSQAARWAREVALVLAGTAAVALVGQLRLPLPFSPVPVTLGSFAVLGVGALLGSRRALGSTVVFALLAASGVPVLAGWQGGVTATFGYVLGYCVAGVVAGQAHRDDSPWWRGALMLGASALVYVPGVAWLVVSTGKPLGAVLAIGVLPFLWGDLFKSLVASLLPRCRL